MTNKLIANAPEKFLPVKTLTREEVHNFNQERIDLITKEFTDGFNFIKNYPKSVTFFGGSRIKENDSYYALAYSLGGRIVKDLGYSVFSGGGPGIMEAANRGAFEAGGQSLGLTIKLPHEQTTNQYLTDNVDLYYFFIRKVCLSFSAEAYIFFPGGFGTLDEFFEILTLVQTHKIEKIPLILVGKDFWSGVDSLIKNEMLTRGTIEENDIDLYKITDDVDEIIEIIRKVPVKENIEFSYKEVV